jgi:hypothetical protein
MPRRVAAPRLAAPCAGLAFAAWAPAAAQQRPTTDAAFVTRLGRDTVALETYRLTPTRVEGTVVVRVPGTVVLRYAVEVGPDGTPLRSSVEIQPRGAPSVAPRRTTLRIVDGRLEVTLDSAGHRRRETRDAPPPGAVLTLMTGFGPSYGLYSAVGPYELLVPHLRRARRDTLDVPAVHVATGRAAKRTFVWRSPTALDVDYFHIAWTRLALDEAGRVVGVDARGTTEQTISSRAEAFDIDSAALASASTDRGGRGLGAVSPNRTARLSVDGVDIALAYGSPRRRGRTILGEVVPFNRVWRTGANEATVLSVGADLTVGGARVPAGTYSVWTIPSPAGVVLVLNRQVGQWGTDYDPSRDLVRLPMQTSAVPQPREEFVIDVVGPPTARALRVAWDTFEWTVPVAAAR